MRTSTPGFAAASCAAANGELQTRGSAMSAIADTRKILARYKRAKNLWQCLISILLLKQMSPLQFHIYSGLHSQSRFSNDIRHKLRRPAQVVRIQTMAWNTATDLDALRSRDLLDLGMAANQLRLQQHPELV